MDEELTLQTLLEKLQSDDPFVRTDAWRAAGQVGAEALPDLARLVAEGELEISRAAKRAMWQIVRDAGRPGHDEARQATVAGLGEVFGEGDPPAQLKRDILWMLSELVHDAEVNVDIGTALLLDPDVGEDARAALQRVGGENAIAALQQGYEQASGSRKAAIACSLRKLGVEIDQPPCPKLKPTKETTVQPVSG